MLIELRERMAATLQELGDLHRKEDRTADDEARIDAILDEVNELGPKILRETKIEDATRMTADYIEPMPNRISGRVPKGETTDGEARDTRSIGKRFAESGVAERYSGAGRGEAFDARSFYHRDDAAMQHTADMSPQELRTLIYSGALAADMVRPQLIPGFFRGEDLFGSLRDVLLNGTTTSDALIYFRELAFTNAAAGVAEATATAGASGLKPESALTFEQATAPVVTIAHWIPMTRQAIDDASQLQMYVEQRLLDGLRLAESNQLLNGAGTPNLTGLLQTANVQALDAAYFLATPVADDGTPNENFNRIARARTLIKTVGRSTGATFIVINPADMEKFLTATDANQQYMGGGPFSGSAITNLWGLRVVEDENIAALTVLVGDGRMAAVWDRMQAQILIDTINDQFVRNMLTLLAEERLALTVYRPQAFAKVTLAA